MEISTDWWKKEGLRFECQGSGRCCTSHGEFGYVFLTLEDRRRIAKHLKIKTSTFTHKYCDKTNGVFHLKERNDNPDCLFLNNKKCSIYEARPTQCRTWPFWPEVMPAKIWKKEVLQFCPGVGKGLKWKPESIQAQLDLQMASEKKLIKGK